MLLLQKVVPLFLSGKERLKKLKKRAGFQPKLTKSQSIHVYNGTIIIANTLYERDRSVTPPKAFDKATVSGRGPTDWQELSSSEGPNPWFDLNPLYSKECVCDASSSSGESDTTRIDDGLNEWGLPKCLVGIEDEEDYCLHLLAEEQTAVDNDVNNKKVKAKKITFGLYKQQKLLIVVVFLIVMISKNKKAWHAVKARRAFTRAKINSKTRTLNSLPILDELIMVSPKSVVISRSYFSGLTLVGPN